MIFIAKTRCHLKNIFVMKHWRRKWQPTPVLLPGKFRGQRSLVDYSPGGRKESNTTEPLLSFFLMCVLKNIYNVYIQFKE